MTQLATGYITDMNMTQLATGYIIAYFKMKDLKFFDCVSCEADLLFAFTHFARTDRRSNTFMQATNAHFTR